VTQGLYRILGGERELLESFVAAPGPAGWRYFAHVREAGSERELYVVDHVTDSEWRLIRFRLLAPGWELLVERSPTGLHAIGPEQVTEFEGVDVVWSPSPWSLHVLGLYLGARGEAATDAVRVRPEEHAERVRVELRRETGATKGAFAVEGSATNVLFGTDLPLRGEEWFELVGGSAPGQPE
jgi:hypothetical protein